MHVNALRRGIRFLRPVLVLSLAWTALPASACSLALPRSYFTLGDGSLKEGATDVSTEGVFILSTRAWSSPDTSWTGTKTFDRHVTVIDLETGAEVPGTLQTSPRDSSPIQYWDPTPPLTQYWKATSPLLPHRRYALSESLSQTSDRPSNAEGSTERRLSFSTGTQDTPSLEVLGALGVSLEALEGDMFDCRILSSTCGCAQVGTGPYTQARLQVPEIHGGTSLGASAYHVEIYATAGTPYDFNHPNALQPVLDHWTVPSSGEPFEQRFTLLKSAGTQNSCFAWRALDEAGHTRSGASVCLETPVNPPDILPAKPPVPLLAPLGLGCSMGGPDQGSAALGLLLALLSATLGGRSLTRRSARFNSSRRALRFLQAVLALSIGWKALPASACDPVSPTQTYFTLGDSNPKEGASDVSPEGVFILSTRAWSIPGTSSNGTQPLDHRVTVIDVETGAEVPGTLQSSPQGSSSIQYWKAASPLSPHQRYTLSESLSQTGARPSDAEGPTERRISFSTGTHTTPPLEVLGALGVSLEPFEAEQTHCEVNSCACYPVMTNSRARVQVPGIQGGNTLGTYHIEIFEKFNLPPGSKAGVPPYEQDWAVSSSGQPSEQFLSLVASPEASLCFNWRVYDDAGHSQNGDPVCVNEDPRPSGLGCSMGGTAPGSAALVLLALLSATLGGRSLIRRESR